MTLEEINTRQTLDCDICHYEIMGTGNETLLTLTEMYILGLTEKPEDSEVMVVCKRCFDDIIYDFKQHHNMDNFEKWSNKELDNKIQKKENIL